MLTQTRGETQFKKLGNGTARFQVSGEHPSIFCVVLTKKKQSSVIPLAEGQEDMISFWRNRSCMTADRGNETGSARIARMIPHP